MLECCACVEMTIMTSLQRQRIRDGSLLEDGPEYLSACVAVGRQLAERLQFLRGSRTLVLALMPSGLAIAHEMARVLRLPQDILVARELHVHLYPDVAAGALSEGSGLCINRAALH